MFVDRQRYRSRFAVRIEFEYLDRIRAEHCLRELLLLASHCEMNRHWTEVRNHERWFDVNERYQAFRVDVQN